MKNIIIEIPDRECLEYLKMLSRIKKEFNLSRNILLTAGLDGLTDRMEKSFIKQINPERLKEITK